jgi:hypothetical protein
MSRRVLVRALLLQAGKPRAASVLTQSGVRVSSTLRSVREASTINNNHSAKSQFRPVQKFVLGSASLAVHLVLEGRQPISVCAAAACCCTLDGRHQVTRLELLHVERK